MAGWMVFLLFPLPAVLFVIGPVWTEYTIGRRYIHKNKVLCGARLFRNTVRTHRCRSLSLLRTTRGVRGIRGITFILQIRRDRRLPWWLYAGETCEEAVALLNEVHELTGILIRYEDGDVWPD